MTVKRTKFSSLLIGPMLLAASLASAPAAWGTETAGEGNAALNALHSLGDRASDLAIRAMAMVGIRYKYGGNTPENGLDCSGLVRYVFKQAWGAELPRTSMEISRVGTKVDRDDLRPGDLVFYNTLRRGFSHVGIYLGDNKFVHSPATGSSIRIESMDLSYWKKRFNGARRISDPEQN
jgi:cell wall-associated NlpC family hydrolase